MHIRVFSFILLMGLAFTFFAEVISTPYASIVRWAPGVVASVNILAQNESLRAQQKRMPIWVTISFNQAASPDFVNQFFKYLKYGNAPAHTRNKNQFIITVPHGTTQSDLQSKLDEANHHFDPNFKTREKIAIEQAAQPITDQGKNCQLPITFVYSMSSQDMLHKAILNNSQDGIRQAVKAGANINSGVGGLPPLVTAVLLDKFVAVECLLESGVNVNITYLTPVR